MQIPRYIDSPPQLFFWEIDEFMLLAACLGIGIVIGGFFTFGSLALGFFVIGQFRKFKSNGLAGQLNHLAHWNNIFNINPSFPKSGVRRIYK